MPRAQSSASLRESRPEMWAAGRNAGGLGQRARLKRTEDRTKKLAHLLDGLLDSRLRLRLILTSAEDEREEVLETELRLRRRLQLTWLARLRLLLLLSELTLEKRMTMSQMRRKK